MADVEDEQQDKKKRRPRRGKRLLIGVLIVAALLLWLNGPGVRWIGGMVLQRVTAAQGMEGEAELHGTLWSGISLRDGSYQSDDGLIRDLKLDSVKVDYSVPQLIQSPRSLSWIKLVGASDVSVDLVLPEVRSEVESATEAKEADAAEAAAPEEGPDKAWDLLNCFHLKNITARIQQGERRWEIEGFSLVTASWEEKHFLEIERLTLPAAEPREDIYTAIETGDYSLSLGPLNLLESLTLEKLNVQQADAEQPLVDAILSLAGGKVELKLLGEQLLDLTMTEGQIDLTEAMAPLGLNLKLGAQVTSLRVQAEGEVTDPASWNPQGEIEVEGIAWGDAQVGMLAVSLDGNQISVLAEGTDTTMDIGVEISLDQAESTADLAELPILINGSLALESIGNLLEAYVPEPPPVQGSVVAELMELKLEKGKLAAGVFELQSTDLSWDGVPLQLLNIAAEAEDHDTILGTIDATMDSDSEIDLVFGFNPEVLSYKSSGTIRAETTGQLAELLTSFQVTDYVGEAMVTWEGRGDFGAGTHEGELELDLEEARIRDGSAFDGSLAAIYSNDGIQLKDLRLTSGDVLLEAEAQWQQEILTLEGLSLTQGGEERLNLTTTMSVGQEGIPEDAPLHLSLQAERFPLPAITRFFMAEPPVPGTFDGDLEINGSLGDLSLMGDLDFTPSQAEQDALLVLDLDLSGNAQVPSSWSGSLNAELQGVTWQETELEAISLQAETIENEVVAKLSVQQSGLSLEVDGRVGLSEAETLAELRQEPIRLEAALSVASIQAFLEDFDLDAGLPIPVDGALEAELKGLSLAEGRLESGSLELKSEGLVLDSVPLEPLDLKAEVVETEQVAAQLRLAFDEKTELAGTFQYDAGAQEYGGGLTLRADQQGESGLGDLARGRNLERLLPAGLELNWNGEGRLEEKHHEGQAQVKATGWQLADSAPVMTLDVESEYTPDSVLVPQMEIVTDALKIGAELAWQDERLTIGSLSGEADGQEMLSGSASLPLDPAQLSAEDYLSQDSTMKLDLTLDQLPLSTIGSLAGVEIPVQGSLSTVVDLSGTPASPELKLNAEAADLMLQNGDKEVPLGRVELALEAVDATSMLNASVEHPDLQPLTLSAEMPFHPSVWAMGERAIEEEPLSVLVKMEESPLKPLETQIPDIESVDGTLALDLGLTGSISEPVLAGDAALLVSSLRLDEAAAPSFRDVDLSLRVDGDTLFLDRLYAIVDGGILEMEGSASLPGEGGPQIDLNLTGQELLIFRNPDVNVRANAEIALSGPWKEAALSGAIGITNSRYYKDIDLLPNQLPGRQKSVLPTVEKTPAGGRRAVREFDIGVPLEPFSNWPVDLRLYTADSFLIRGNLATSDIDVDLQINGSLGEPVPNGQIQIDDGKFTLPFTEITVETGLVTFEPATGFNGDIRFKAEAESGDYRINIFLYHKILQPQFVLTSVPPLPQEDIITLLVTGTTRDALTGDDVGSVAASRAARLFLGQVRGGLGDGEPDSRLLEELEDRAELEVGRVNPETGQQTLTGSIRILDRLYFVGDIDRRNDYRTLFKYVFEFR